VDLREIRPGLRYWTAPHPQWKGATDWPEEVGCVYYEAPGSLVLVDPLLPRREKQSFLAALDREVERLERPVSVLLTAPWHARDAASLAQRYGTVVWAHPVARERLRFRSASGPLPDGIETFIPAGVREGDVAFYIRPHRALVVAEFFMGIEDGLRVCPPPALEDRTAFHASLRSLLDLPIDHVLVSHGEPVIGEGERRIDEALRAFATPV
jgi:glyoxylase-like metal-dependent hydrolase (beta-lactamase superfamily II)